MDIPDGQLPIFAMCIDDSFKWLATTFDVSWSLIGEVCLWTAFAGILYFAITSTMQLLHEWEDKHGGF